MIIGLMILALHGTWLINTNGGYHKYAWPLLFYQILLLYSHITFLGQTPNITYPANYIATLATL